MARWDPLPIIWLSLPLLAFTSECVANDFEMKTIDQTADPNAQPQILGGTLAERSSWPVTFVFEYYPSKPCSSTVVGQRVVLTAAHCVKDKAQGIVNINSTVIRSTCYRHPDYTDTSSELNKVSPDFALCLLDTSLTGSEFEIISIDSNLLKVTSEIRLLGFGCTSTSRGAQGFGTLYEGDAKVSDLPNNGSYYLTTTGDAACFGDSGGAAYVRYTNGKRFIVAVNSRSDIKQKTWLSATSPNGFHDWAKKWSEKHVVKICGLDPEAKGCRPQ